MPIIAMDKTHIIQYLLYLVLLLQIYMSVGHMYSLRYKVNQQIAYGPTIVSNNHEDQQNHIELPMLC